MKVLNLGSLNIDYVYPVEHFVTAGETILTGELQVNSGGKGLNQSAALARAGLEVWHAGLLGAESASLAETLNRFGVNTRLMRTVQERSGHPSGAKRPELHSGLSRHKREIDGCIC